MKVLQLCAIDFTVEKLLLPLVDEMTAQGYEVHIACFVDEIGTSLQQKGYVVHHIPFKRNVNIFSHLTSLIKLIQLMKKQKYAIVHTHTPVASLIGRLAAKICKTPLVVYTAHGFYFHEHMRKVAYFLFYSLEKIWAKLFTDFLFFQSMEDYQLAMDKKFKHPSKLLLISNGVSRVKFNPAQYDTHELKKQYRMEDHFVFTFIGRIVTEKGIRELIEAFTMMSSKWSHVMLMVIGGESLGDRDVVRINEIVRALPMETQQKILLMGFQNNIPEWLALSDVFVLPSYREGLPRSIIEAMAMGKPIIATTIRGCRELVTDGRNGYLCTPKSTTSLLSAMEKIVENAPQKEAMGRTSRKLFLKHYDEQVVLNKQMDIFNHHRISYYR